MAASLEERLRTAEETLEWERQQHQASQEAQLTGAGDEVSGGTASVGSEVNYDELSTIIYITVTKWSFKKPLN